METTLRKHHLSHIPELKIDSKLFHERFASGCSMQNCNGECCRWGVFTDVKEKEKILANAELIKRHLEPHQKQDTSEWFENGELPDADFPSGIRVGTQATEYGCVFLDSGGKCALQKACINEGLDPYFLKPFFCVAFPVTIDHGCLTIDDIELANRPQCCQLSAGGPVGILELCEFELLYVLGKDGVDELRGFVGSA